LKEKRRRKNMIEDHVISKKEPDTDFDATCVFCGSIKRIHLWPHRNKVGQMVGFIFACSACKAYADGCRFVFERKE
jgi:hypothetical protein